MLLRRLRSLRHIVVVPGVLGAVGCSDAPGSETGRTAESSAAIEGGELDTEHDSVFALVANHREFFSACTATLIAPNLLLTARHCVSANDDAEVICGRAEFGRLYLPENLFASNPVVLGQGGQRWFRGRSLRVPSEGDDTCGFDVALVMLDENVPPEIATPSVPRIDREVEQGEAYVAVGYGVDVDGEENEGRQVLRDQRVSCAPGECRQGSIIRPSEFLGETGICSGDSGGPAFDVDGKVVGVVSRGADDCTIPIYGAVASWRDMIVGFAQEAAVLGGYEPAFWVTSGSSEPPPMVIVGPGESCGPRRECSEGHVCHAGACAAACSAEVACGSGLSCQLADSAGASVCLPSPEPGREMGEAGAPGGVDTPAATCAYRPSGRSGWSPVAALGLAVALRFRRARKRDARRRQ